MRWSSGSALTLVLALSIVVACQNDSVTTPSKPDGRAMRESAGGTGTFTAQIGVSETNDVNNGDLGPFDLGITIPARARYRISIAGSVSLFKKPNMPCEPPNFNPPTTTYGPLPADQPMGTNFGGFPLSADGSTSQSAVMYTATPMTLQGYRRGVIGMMNCADGVAYTGLYGMSGSQTVTVDVLEILPRNGVVITPDPAPAIPAGDSLTFHAVRKIPYEVTHEDLYFEPYAWRFTPDSTAAKPNPVQEIIRSRNCVGYDCTWKATVSGTVSVYTGLPSRRKTRLRTPHRSTLMSFRVPGGTTRSSMRQSFAVGWHRSSPSLSPRGESAGG